MRTTGRRTKRAATAAAFLLMLGLCLCGAREARAQWTSGGGNTTTQDKVGVGTAAPTAVLHAKGNLSSPLTGTVAVTQNSATLTGTGTVFSTDLAVGDSIKIGAEVFTISAIASDTSLTLDSNYLGATASGVTAYRDPNLFAVDNGDAVSKLIVTKSGKVGIGSTSPGSSMVDIVNTSAGVYSPPANPIDSVRIRTLNNSLTSNNYSALKLQVTANNGVNNAIGFVTLIQPFYLSHNSEFAFNLRKGDGSYVEAMRMQSSGNIGIGTVSPIRRLHVSGANGTDGAEFVLENTGMPANSRKLNLWGDSTAAGGAGRFYLRLLNDAGSATTRDFMAFDNATGNVGVGAIGATGPAYKLDVAGPVRSSSGGFVFPDGTSQTTAASTVSFGSTAGTAVQGNTTLTVAAGAGMSGGGPVTLGAGGTLTLANDDRGSAQFIFKNVGGATGTQFSAGSNPDTLRFEGTGGTTVSFDANNKKVIINSSTASSSGWTDSGTSVNLTSATDRVGIGTSNPATVLHVVTSGATKPQFILQNSTAATQIETSLAGASAQWNYGMDQTDGNKFKFSTDGSGNLAAGATLTMTPGGGVGIGTTTPFQRLQIGGNTPAGTSTPDAISLGATYSDAAGTNAKLRLWDDGNQNVYGLGVSASQFDFMTPATTRYVWNVGGAEKMRLDASGNLGVGKTPDAGYKLDVAGAINATGAITGATVNATYQDVAEWVPSTQKLQAGTVVVLDKSETNHVLASTTAYDTKVAGVVSAEPGVILGVGGDGKLKVATTGRVRVKADATRARIEVGDLLVTSDVEGVAMKSVEVDLGGVKIHRPGTIIGKALEPLESGTGEILVLLSLQ